MTFAFDEVIAKKKSSYECPYLGSCYNCILCIAVCEQKNIYFQD